LKKNLLKIFFFILRTNSNNFSDLDNNFNIYPKRTFKDIYPKEHIISEQIVKNYFLKIQNVLGTKM